MDTTIIIAVLGAGFIGLVIGLLIGLWETLFGDKAKEADDVKSRLAHVEWKTTFSDNRIDRLRDIFNEFEEQYKRHTAATNILLTNHGLHSMKDFNYENKLNG